MISITDVLDGRYRLVGLLGQGGMSDVYEAIDERSDTAVAIKFVRSADPDLARRFAQEVRALGRVEHPGLVRLLTTGMTGGHAYLVMELVRGPTLAQTLRDGPLGPARTALLGATLADALGYVQNQGIVHRDVKPSNILLDADGRARLGDFGVARLLDASVLTVAGTTLGTAAYMAPEQLENHQVGPSADIWALGMVLLECLTGHRVYEGAPSEVVARRLTGSVPLPVDLPVPWKLLLSGMLDHRPDQRLDGAQVAALLATSPFRDAWLPSDNAGPDPLAPTAILDLTALAPDATSTALLVPEPAPAVTARVPDATSTALLVPQSTRTLPEGSVIPPRSRRWWPVALGAMLVGALVIALLLGLGSSPTPRAPLVSARSTTTSPTTTSTTTTTIAVIPNALAALDRDVAGGESAGTIDSGDGQTISQQSQQAVTDEAAGNADQAANDLQQAATAIAIGGQQGTITQGEAATLQADLTALASALGLTAASTPPTTPPTAPAGPTPGNHGHGGHGGKGD